jgi:hypothetical protein
VGVVVGRERKSYVVEVVVTHRERSRASNTELRQLARL